MLARGSARPARRAVQARILPLVAVILGFAFLQWLRAPEPPGMDESLFATYGHWLGRGHVLYRDLWDSKPPGIFLAYAAAERVVGIAHAAWFLELLSAAIAALLAYRLIRSAGGSAFAAGAGGFLTAFLPSAPPWAGTVVSAQAEVLQMPLLLAAALAARRGSLRWAALAGALLGCATLVKIVAVVLLPLPWVFAPGSARRRPAFAAAVLAGFAVPLAAGALALAAQGALAEAVRAVLLYPQAYAAEVASRTPLESALARGAVRLGGGLPLATIMALAGILGLRRNARARRAAIWLLLAALGVVLQRQMAVYQILLLAPPLALLAAEGLGGAVELVVRAWRPASRGELRGLATLALVALGLALPATLEMRRWSRHYAPHVALHLRDLSQADFWNALGGPGPTWNEAGEIASRIHAAQSRSHGHEGAGEAPAHDALFVWGLAPALYARSGCPPATRYAFHQTLLVEDSPLSRRWPGAGKRRSELLESLRRTPPRFVVIVSGDRSGLESADSRTELAAFPELERFLSEGYRSWGRTRSYELLECASSE